MSRVQHLNLHFHFEGFKGKLHSIRRIYVSHLND